MQSRKYRDEAFFVVGFLLRKLNVELKLNDPIKNIQN